MPEAESRTWLKALGPGLLFAATSVGVSHLVQSTRAGASYGLALLGVVILANVIKYPAFRFGPHYAAATGTSLLEGYRRQGKWALWLYAALTVLTMFVIEAAVTVVTAGLASATLGLSVHSAWISALLIGGCAALLAGGKYRWLDRVTKVLVIALTLSTLGATLIVLPRIDWSQSWFVAVEDLDASTIAFMVAVAGWMPSAIDISVWQSLWTVARRHDTKYAPKLSESMFDFHVGYVGTALFAVCFVLMGAGVMYGSGVQFEASAGAFAAQVIRLYTETLGDWSQWLIGPAAFFVMFSTTLAVVDGFPRALATLHARFQAPEGQEVFELDRRELQRIYWIWLWVLAIGALAILAFLMQSFKAMIDLATTLSFLTAPLLAWLNHRAVMASEVPEECRPRPWLIAFSWFGIVSLAGFGLYYLSATYL